MCCIPIDQISGDIESKEYKEGMEDAKAGYPPRREEGPYWEGYCGSYMTSIVRSIFVARSVFVNRAITNRVTCKTS